MDNTFAHFQDWGRQGVWGQVAILPSFCPQSALILPPVYPQSAPILQAQLVEAQQSTIAAEERSSQADSQAAAAIKTAHQSGAEVQQLKEELSHLRSQCEGERSHAALWEQRWNEATAEATEIQNAAQRKLASATTHCNVLEGKLTEAETTLHLKEQEIINLREARDHEKERVSQLQDSAATSAKLSSDETVHQVALPSPGPSSGGASFGPSHSVRAGEVEGMKAQIRELENARSHMAEELVALTTRNNNLTKQAEMAPKLQAQCKQLHRRYNGALEMAGEKDEELEAVRSEMQQVKAVFRDQVQDLMKQLEQAQRK